MVLYTLRGRATTTVFSIAKSVPKKVTTCRFIHTPSVVRGVPVRHIFPSSCSKRTSVLGAISVRHNSTVTIDALPVPEPPVAPVVDAAQAALQFHANGDPTFSSIGLCGWSPVGLMEYLIESVHVYTNLPWWGTIVATTICTKLLLLKWYIQTQKIQAAQQRCGPELNRLRKELLEAQTTGNLKEASYLLHQHTALAKKHGLTPGRIFLNSGIQGFVSLTSFLALRKITNAPIESLKTGGYFWFIDLTAPDPCYALPILSCLSIAALTEVMIRSGSLETLNAYKYLMRGLPLISLPFMFSFSSGIQLFWLTTNIMTVSQILLFRIPQVRELCKVPPLIQVQAPQTMTEQYQEMLAEIRKKKDLKRAQIVEDHLLKAASAPIPKTYAYNPKKRSVPEKLRKTG